MATRHPILKALVLTITILVFGNVQASETVNYGYDLMNRLIRVEYGDGTVVAYAYDLMGNRYSKSTRLSGAPVNNPPSVPGTPAPSNGATDVDPQDVTLTWVGGDPDTEDALLYHVYFGTDADPPLYSSTRDLSLNLGLLDANQTYYWKIEAKDSQNETTAGPVWSFSTLNHAPEAPVYDWPFDGSDVVSGGIMLSWFEPGDPDPMDTITGYDVYFGTAVDPPLVQSDHPDTTYDPGTLTAGTTYYWKVRAKDNHGAASTSPVWSFTVLDHAPVTLTDPTYSVDTTLTQAAGPYIVQGAMTVDAGVVLTIEPGTVFKFESGASFVLNGNIDIQGTSSQKVIFTSWKDDRFGGDTNGDGSATTPAKGDWVGIQCNVGVADAVVQMNHFRVEYGTIGIEIVCGSNAVSIILTNGHIGNHSMDGLNVTDTTDTQITFDITGNIFTDNDQNGFKAYFDDRTTSLEGSVANNAMKFNGGSGLDIFEKTATSDLDLSDNTAHHNTEDGIKVINGGGGNDKYNIAGNISYQNKTGIYIHLGISVSEFLIQGNDLYENSNGLYMEYNSGPQYICYVLVADNEIHHNVADNIHFHVVYLKNGRGIYCFPSGYTNTTTEFRGNHIYMNEGDAIKMDPAGTTVEALFTLNHIHDNGGIGIHCPGRDFPATACMKQSVIAYNDIYGNKGSAVYMETEDETRIHFNNLEENSLVYEVENHSASNVDARHNYWGAFMAYAMETGEYPTNMDEIHDIHDDINLGTVYYSEWKDIPISIPTENISDITYPVSGKSYKYRNVRIEGVAACPNEGVQEVHVRIDGGAWMLAEGKESWSLNHTFPGDGTYTIESRVTDKLSNMETPGPAVTFSIDSTLPTTSGVLDSNENWSGQVDLTGDVTVPAGVTLTINPGTVVNFLARHDDQMSGSDLSRAELIIYGSLTAGDTAETETVFTSSSDTPVRGDWGGIRVLADAANASITLENCRVEYGNAGVDVRADAYNVDVTITDSTIQKTSGTGIYVQAASGTQATLNISGNSISDHDVHGIYTYIHHQDTGATRMAGSIANNTVDLNKSHGLFNDTRGGSTTELIVSGNTIQNNTLNGIRVHCDNNVTDFDITGNTLSGNDRGMHIYTGDMSDLSFTVHGNNVFENLTGIYMESSSGIEYHRILITENDVHHNTGGDGLYCLLPSYSNTIFEIRGNTVRSNSGNGITMAGGTHDSSVMEPLIMLNQVHDNNLLGINSQSYTEPLIAYNDIHDNTGGGVYVESADEAQIHYNTLNQDNGTIELETGTAPDVSAVLNYWGTTLTAEMDAGGNPKNITGIYDQFDDAALGSVDYAGWLAASVTLPSEPVSRITAPLDLSSTDKFRQNITGIAVAPDGVSQVEVSIDGGAWVVADGKEKWSLVHDFPGGGTYTIETRATGISSGTGTQVDSIQFTITAPPSNSGPLTGDETWDGEVILTGDVTVPAGITLTINPGTRVGFLVLNDDQFSGTDSTRSELIVYGTLVAGSDTGPEVVFTPHTNAPQKGDWGGILVRGDTSDVTLNLNNCRVEYGTLGVDLMADSYNAAVTIKNSVIQQNQGKGIYVYGATGAQMTLDITGNSILENDGFGLHAHTTGLNTHQSGSISGNLISDNGDAGKYIQTENDSTADLILADNTISRNTNYGLHIKNHYTKDHENYFEINGNTVFDNDGGILAYSKRSAVHLKITDNEVYDSTMGIDVDCTGNTTQLEEILVSGNQVHDNTGEGIKYSTSSTGFDSARIQENDVHDNQGDGITAVLDISSTATADQQPLIVKNRVYQNNGRGVYCQTDARAVVVYNEIHDNVQGGLFIAGGTDSVCHLNNLMDNGTPHELENGAGSAVNARYNYWGTDMTGIMETGEHPRNLDKILDIYDDINLGTVYYSDWKDVALTMPTENISDITYPVSGHSYKHRNVRIKGVAACTEGVQEVHVRIDGGAWILAEGKESWSLDHAFPGDGAYTIESRVTDKLLNLETPGPGITFTIDNTLPTTSGTLEGNETWSGQVTLTGDVTVPSGIALTVTPGTVINVQARHDDRMSGGNTSRTELFVHGDLTVGDTDGSEAVITSSSATPVKTDWGGIYVTVDSADAAIIFENCRVEYGSLGVDVRADTYNVDLTITDSTIQKTSGTGIYVQAASGTQATLNISGNSISDNDLHGIFTYIHHLDTGATRMAGSITNNTVDLNKSHGLFTDTRGGSTTELIVSGNTIQDNTHHGIRVLCDNNVTDFDITGNTLSGNDRGMHIYTGNMSGLSFSVQGNDVFENAIGIYMESSSSAEYHRILITENDVHHNTGNGLYCTLASYSNTIFEIRGNTVRSNSGDGITTASNYGEYNVIEPLIMLNQVHGNGGLGVYAKTYAEPLIAYNDIYDNTGGGVYVESAGNTLIHCNTLNQNNGTNELETGTAPDVSAVLNYWGPTLTAEMDAGGNPKNITGIYDQFDDPVLGSVDYADWLSASVTLPTEPVSRITAPLDLSSTDKFRQNITGIAVAPDGVSHVEVSIDGGAWVVAEGKEKWSLVHDFPGGGTYTIETRATGISSGTGTQVDSIQFTITAPPSNSGPLTGDETWDGEVILTGDVTVPAGITLTINPGAQIKFFALNDDQLSGTDSTRSELIVYGTLVAGSDTGAQTVFTSHTDAPQAGDWAGIIVRGETSDVSLDLDNCRVEYGTVGVDVLADPYNASVIIQNCVIQKNQTTGIYVSGASQALVTLDALDNTITENVGTGLYTYGTSKAQMTLNITGNSVTHNDGYGIRAHAHYLNTHQSGSISNNTASDNGDAGICIRTASNSISNLVVSDNNTHRNANYGIYVLNGITNANKSRLEIRGNTASNSDKGIFADINASAISFEVTDNEVFDNTMGLHVDCEGNTNQLEEILVMGNHAHHNTAEGIKYHTKSTGIDFAHIQDNDVHDNQGDGITAILVSASTAADAKQPLIALNHVYQNTGRGVYCATKDRAVIVYNDIHNNSGIGLTLTADGGAEVHHNNLNLNSGLYALENLNSAEVDAGNNYWGTTVTSEIDAMIYDNADDPGVVGIVHYDPVLTSAVTVPTAPVSWINAPADGFTSDLYKVHFEGLAVAPGGVEKVELSVDNGATWTDADGKERWSLDYNFTENGTFTVLARATGYTSGVETPIDSIQVTIYIPYTPSGTLTEDETWSDTVRLTGDVTVPSGITLTVTPGTTVLFPALSDDQASGSNTAKTELIVHGSLIADASTGAVAVFTSSADTPKKRDWEGIRVIGDTNDVVVTLNNCTVEYANIGVDVRPTGHDAAVTIIGCTIQETYGEGICIYGLSGAQITMNIDTNTIHNIGGRAGIYTFVKDTGSSQTGSISNNTIDNNYRGIWSQANPYGTADITLAGNTITNYGYHGMYLYLSSADSVNRFDVTGNTLNGDLGYGIYAYSNSSSVDYVIQGNEVAATHSSPAIHLYGKPAASETVDALIADNSVHDNSAKGINCSVSGYGSFTAEIRGNHVYSNDGDGIYIDGDPTGSSLQMDLVMTLNHVHNNGGVGMFYEADENPVIAFNNIHDNTGNGMNIAAHTLSRIIYNNLPLTNGTYELENKNGTDADARFNYWGTTVTSEIDAAIFDNTDDSARGTVEYVPILSSAMTIPTAPVTRITDPTGTAPLSDTTIPVKGVAAAPEGMATYSVEVSTDGITWTTALGKEDWAVDMTVAGDGTYTITSRITDGTTPVAGSESSVTVTVDTTP